MQSKTYTFKFKSGELLLTFYTRSNHQTKVSAQEVHSFNGKIPNFN